MSAKTCGCDLDCKTGPYYCEKHRAHFTFERGYPPLVKPLPPPPAPPARKETAMSSDLQKGDASTEAWREYDFGDRVYRINNPVTVFYRAGGSTHRVVDTTGVVHCVPAPGVNGCVLRWQNRDTSVPVNW